MPRVDLEAALDAADANFVKSCTQCHTVDGSRLIGPSWLHLYGSTVALQDGRRVTVDDDYILASIEHPAAELVDGYGPVMPRYSLSAEQKQALVAYIRSLR